MGGKCNISMQPAKFTPFDAQYDVNLNTYCVTPICSHSKLKKQIKDIEGEKPSDNSTVINSCLSQLEKCVHSTKLV